MHALHVPHTVRYANRKAFAAVGRHFLSVQRSHGVVSNELYGFDPNQQADELVHLRKCGKQFVERPHSDVL